MNFGEVIEGAKKDDWNKYGRKGWNGKGMWIHKTTPPTSPFSEDKSNFEQIPYFEMKTAKNKFTPWIPSQEDMFAEDWELIKS